MDCLKVGIGEDNLILPLPLQSCPSPSPVRAPLDIRVLCLVRPRYVVLFRLRRDGVLIRSVFIARVQHRSLHRLWQGYTLQGRHSSSYEVTLHKQGRNVRHLAISFSSSHPDITSDNSGCTNARTKAATTRTCKSQTSRLTISHSASSPSRTSYIFLTFLS